MTEIKENILLAKSLSGELSNEEKSEFNQLLRDNFALKCEYVLLKKAWNISIQKQTDSNSSIKTKTTDWKFVSGVAASLLVFLSMVFLFNYNDQKGSNFITYQTSIGETKEIFLEDNSKIVLNAMSKLSVPEVFKENKREIYLEGEAFFEVTKNKHQPFSVKTPTVKVEVLGTIFNVRSYNETSNDQVYLSSGKVALENQDYQYHMLPNELYTFNKSTKSNEISVKPKDYKIDWLSGDLNFENAHVSEVITRIKRNYNINIDTFGITVEDIITASFNKKQSAEEILQLIAIITDKSLIKLPNNRYLLK